MDELEILSYLHSNNIPQDVIIELLNECNLRCEHCYLPNHEINILGTNEIKKSFR